MNSLRFADLHCDTLLTMQQTGKGLDSAPGHICLEKLARGGVLLQCFAAFLPMADCAEEYHIRVSPWEFFLSQAALFERETARFPEILRPVRSMAEIGENRRAGRISAMLTLEDSACLEGKPERIQTLYDKGVRMATLTWNYENCVGYPHSENPALHRRGLKEFGFTAVEEMNRLGIVVDVSHLSEGGFWDVVRAGKKPFAASHSCARALCGHSRNLSDEQLRALGDKGGVCGVNFFSRFLRDGADHTENADILAHMEHIADKAGIEAVALGSDFDGIDCTLEMGDCTGLPHLEELIADRFGCDAAEKICAGNALRLFADVIG